MNRTADVRSTLTWSSVTLPAGPAEGSVTLRVGEVVGPSDGPTVSIVCGVHGDEGPWGALAVLHALRRPLAGLRGRLRVILAANPTSVAADSRCSPLDQLDLNRVFPGSTTGSHSERLAAALADVTRGSDVLIDLHGGGSWCVNAFTFRFPGGEALAAAVGAPFVVDRPLGANQLTGHAAADGATVVAVEMGGRSAQEMAWRERLGDGVERMLAVAGALPKRLAAPPAPVPVDDLTTLRPSAGGVFVPSVREPFVGTVVDGGTELGVVHDLATMAPIEAFTAPFERTAVLLLRPHVTVLEGGAMTYVVAAPRAADQAGRSAYV